MASTRRLHQAVGIFGDCVRCCGSTLGDRPSSLLRTFRADGRLVDHQEANRVGGHCLSWDGCSWRRIGHLGSSSHHPPTKRRLRVVPVRLRPRRYFLCCCGGHLDGGSRCRDAPPQHQVGPTQGCRCAGRLGGSVHARHDRGGSTVVGIYGDDRSLVLGWHPGGNLPVTVGYQFARGAHRDADRRGDRRVRILSGHPYLAPAAAHLNATSDDLISPMGALAMHHKVVLPCGAWERQTPDGARCFGACSTFVSSP